MSHPNSPGLGDEITAVKMLLVEVLQELARAHPAPDEFLRETRRRILAAAAQLTGPKLVTLRGSRCSEFLAEDP